MACEDGSWMELARIKWYWHSSPVPEKCYVPIKTSYKCDVMDGRSCCIILYQVTKNYMPTVRIIYKLE
jgi:hypothetical protein